MQKYSAHFSNITALHYAQFGKYGSLYDMGAIQQAESTPHEKEDILEAVRIWVNGKNFPFYQWGMGEF